MCDPLWYEGELHFRECRRPRLFCWSYKDYQSILRSPGHQKIPKQIIREGLKQNGYIDSNNSSCRLSTFA